MQPPISMAVTPTGDADALVDRGAADALIDATCPHLRSLQPRRRLRFGRLLLFPLDPVIVAPGAWRSHHPALPRDALVRIAQQVKQSMGAAVRAIDAEVSGCTTDDLTLIRRVGQGLWTHAARVLTAFSATADSGSVAGVALGSTAWKAATLLHEASAVETMVVASTEGLLPPKAEMVRMSVERVLESDPAVLPMLLAILITRVPHVVTCLDDLLPGRAGAKVRAARDDAAAMLLQRLGGDLDIAAQIESGSLADAAARARQWQTMLRQLETRRSERDLRTPVHDIRHKLDVACRVRFTRTLEQALLAPLRDAAAPIDGETATLLEITARGLRALEAAARGAGGGPLYDRTLAAAAAFVGSPALRRHLSAAEQARLVEILAGSRAAVALLVRTYGAG